MKKLLINLLILVVAVCAFGACDGVENSITQAGTFANVFKVNGSQIVVPSTGEAYTVSNISSTGLKSGDKAYLEVSYCYDSQTMATPVMNVEKVCAPVESLDICSSSEFNAETRAKYNSPLKGICAINLYTLDNYGSTSGKSDFLWADDEDITGHDPGNPAANGIGYIAGDQIVDLIKIVVMQGNVIKTEVPLILQLILRMEHFLLGIKAFGLHGHG